jgi:signal transduction histidine kinase
MTYHWVVPLTAALLNAVVGLLVLRKNPRAALNRVFAFCSLTIVFWNLNIFALYFLKTPEVALYWSAVFRVGTVMGGSAAAHMMITFSRTRSRVVWTLLGVSYALALVLLGANAVGSLVVELRRYPWGLYPVGAGLYELLPLSMAYNFALSIGVLTYVMRTSNSPRQRQQAKLWLGGAAIAMPLGMTNLLATFDIPFYPLGNLASAVYAGFIAYSIVRYRLMDIDIVLTKGGSYAVGTILLILPAFAVDVWAQRRSFGRIDVDYSVALFLLLMLVAMLFPMLRARTEIRLKRSFFAKKHESRAILSEFTRSIVRIFHRDELIQRLSEVLTSTLSTDRIAVILFDENRASYVVSISAGVPPTTSEFASDDPFILVMKRRAAPVLRDELGASRDPTERSVATTVCEHNAWELCLPLIARDRLLGIIGLGRKTNRDAFVADELDLLGTLAAEASVALENARLYEELTRSQEIIRRADRLSALGTLAAGIAHEIRNPLVSIQTFFQLAPQRLDDQEFLTEFLHLTSTEVKRITDLISDLLSFAKSPTTTTRDVNLNEVLDSVIRLLEPQIRQSRVALRRDLSDDVPPASGDRDQLKQVFLNVALNAIESMPDGGEISFTSRIAHHNGEQFCQVAIRDSGPGIPSHLLDDIFNPFFTTKEKGTGLGLAITNQVVIEHGGFITVESVEGKGTTFRVHLRCATTLDETVSDWEPRKMVGNRPRHW